MQLVFVVVFGGLFIINLEKIGLGDAKYINHDPLTGRLPIIDCNNVVGAESLICLFNISTSKGETPLLGTAAKRIFGLGPIIGVAQSLNQDFIGTVITLLKACLILYVLLQFMKSIDKVIFEITGTGAFEGGNVDFKQTMKNLKGKLEIGARIARYSGITALNKVKQGGKFLDNKRKELRDLHQGKNKKNNQDDQNDKGSTTGSDSLKGAESDTSSRGGGTDGAEVETMGEIASESAGNSDEPVIITAGGPDEDVSGSESASEYGDD